MARLTPKQAADKIDGKADKAIRALALELSKRIILRTPVDTGRARGNWFAAIRRPARRTTTSTDRSGQATVARTGRIVRRFGAGDVYYITNGLPYIIPLEHGHSSQAPAGSGMVKVSIAELKPVGAKIARDLRAR